MNEIDLLKRKLERERLARKEAESIIENKSLELYLANQQLKEAKQLQELFLASMSHEIRTPMNGVIGMADLLSKTSLSEEQEEFVSTIKEAANGLLTIINDILDLSKIEAGKIAIYSIPFNLTKNIKTLINIIKPKVNQRNISLHYITDTQIPPVIVGDPVRLNQVLLNLASNAIKFTDNGEIKISARLIESKDENIVLEFSVQDSGIGIPENKLSAIFENYSQAEAYTNRKYGGTGLGLAISKKLVELQGGSISVSSKVNIGTTFTFTLPLKKGSEIATEEKPAADSGEENSFSGLNNKKILVVEDNVITQRLAYLLLTKWSAEVDIAENGKIALEKLSVNDYDLVLMDIHMPEMDGIEAAIIIRTTLKKPVCEIPIIAMTASTLPRERDQCLAAGVNDCITKPFQAEELYEKIAAFILN
jgi:signal transduction histidine kinase/CheY-like chemotaxis protein